MMEALFPMRALVTEDWPCWAAKWRAVLPSLSCTSTRAPGVGGEVCVCVCVCQEVKEEEERII